MGHFHVKVLLFIFPPGLTTAAYANHMEFPNAFLISFVFCFCGFRHALMNGGIDFMSGLGP